MKSSQWIRTVVPFKLRQLVKRWLNKIAASYFNLSAIENTSSDDVFIAGYPKSGNTWLQNIIVELVYGFDASAINDSLLQELVPDVHYKRYYKRFLGSMLFKTHFLPRPEYRRVIYIVRDGRDVMVSYYHYLTALGYGYKSIRDLIDQGDGLFPSSWGTHVREWINNPYDAEMLVIRYEDLLGSPKDVISRIIEFLKIDVPASRIDTAIDRTSFSKMQKKEKSSGWDDKRQWPKEQLFVRRGKSGSYIDEMTSEEVSLFESRAHELLEQLGYKTENS